jgi:hypothetical protein
VVGYADRAFNILPLQRAAVHALAEHPTEAHGRRDPATAIPAAAGMAVFSWALPFAAVQYEPV